MAEASAGLRREVLLTQTCIELYRALSLVEGESEISLTSIIQ